MPLTPISVEIEISRTAPTARPALAMMDPTQETALVAWEQDGQIRGQRMTVTGIRRGPEFPISTSESVEVFSPAVAPAHGGSVFVVWLERPVEAAGSAGPQVERGDLRGQLIDIAGAKVGRHVIIAENARFGEFHRPSVDSTPAAEVNVAWVGDHPDDSRRTAPLVQRVGFDPPFPPPQRASVVGERLFATANRGGDVVAPNVATQWDARFGGLFVTWFAGPTGFEDSPFRGQIFNFQDDGSLAPAGETELHDRVVIARNVAIVNIDGGSYVAAWRPRLGGLTGAILNPDGTRADLISLSHDFVEHPVLARLPFGFAAAWVGNNDQDVSVAAFSGDGSSVGPEHRANEGRFGAQSDLALATFPSGRFMVAWTNVDFPARPGAPSPSVRVRGFQASL
jgi:hypothetical protein